MMKKEIVREVAFGKAIARITVTAAEYDKNFEGYNLGKEVKYSKKIEIVAPDGRVVAVDSHVFAAGYSQPTAKRFEQGNFDKSGKITIVGQATTAGEETANEINVAIEEMEAILSEEFGVKTENQIRKEEEIEVAKAIVAAAEREGIKNLLTQDELTKWKKNYNDLHNEGGEGYIPNRISRERYQRALIVLSKLNGR